MRSLSLVIIVVILFSTVSSLAVLLPEVITESETDCSYPALASSQEGVTVLAYVVEGDVIPIDLVQVRALQTVTSDGMWYTEPITLNSGGQPSICWSRSGFHCAFVSGPVILVYHSLPNHEWDLENYAIIETNGPILGIDLYGVPTDAAGPDVFMAVHTVTDNPNGDHHVMYASHSQYFGWTDLTWVATQPVMNADPQITWGIGPAGPWPTIFYLDNNTIKHTTLDFANGWSTPVVVPGDGVSGPSPFASQFDVITRSSFERDIIGLGAQPTCPCGTIHHQSFEPGSGWEASTDITTDYSTEYDWPRSPHLATDPDGRLHALWQQLSSTSQLEPWHTTLEYWVYDDGSWADQSDLFYGFSGYRNIGENVALAVAPSSHPVVAWTERDTINGEPQPAQVIVARDSYLSSAPDLEMATPGLKLSAWPNPFNPVVNLSFNMTEDRTVKLDVFDVRGRKVARLLDRVVGSGQTEISWDGKNSTGFSLPSGIYFARLVTGSDTAIVKLVLAE